MLEDGEEIPIEFISKTLTIPERKWSTYEKEAFAIFYALRKWETHLRDVHFTLFTDHRNLTFMAKDPNAKVASAQCSLVISSETQLTWIVLFEEKF